MIYTYKILNEIFYIPFNKIFYKSFKPNKTTFVFKRHSYHAYGNLSFRVMIRYFNYLCVTNAKIIQNQ